MRILVGAPAVTPRVTGSRLLRSVASPFVSFHMVGSLLAEAHARLAGVSFSFLLFVSFGVYTFVRFFLSARFEFHNQKFCTHSFQNNAFY